MNEIRHEDVFKSKADDLKRDIEAMARVMGWDGEADHCRACNEPVTGFVDELSEQEYYISGMCQVCQDKIWGAMNE